MLKSRPLSDNLKFAIFCTGIAVAMASSMIFLFVLCLNLNGIRPLQYESNPIIAIAEIWLLAMATATCFVASDIYYKYLKLKSQTA
jgi:hypothetical protein